MAKGGAGKGARKKHREPRLSGASGSLSARSSKNARRNALSQQRSHKRQQVLSAHRATSSESSAPKVVALVAAGEGAATVQIAQQLFAHSTSALDGAATVVLQRQRLTLVQPTRRVEAVLDAMKAADVLLLAIPADGGLDKLGEQVPACLHRTRSERSPQ